VARGLLLKNFEGVFLKIGILYRILEGYEKWKGTFKRKKFPNIRNVSL
jgi:hypothetical protein